MAVGWRSWLVAVSCLLAPVAAQPLELRLTDAEDKPLAGARVIVLGRTGSAITDRDGRAVLQPIPAPPFELLVTRSDGVAFRPVLVRTVPPAGTLEVRLQAAFADEVTVLSTSPPDLEVPPAAAFTLIGRADLVERRPDSLAATVETVPGATSSEAGLAAVPAIRGLASSRTLILLDDGRVTAERRAGPSATYLDPSTVEGVEVVRGPGSVAYGSDAFGGVIRARTRIPGPGEAQALHYAVSGADGVGERSVAADVSTTLAGGGLVVGGSYRDYGDYRSPRGSVYNSGGTLSGFRLGWQRPLLAGNLRVLWRSDEGEDIGKPATDSSLTRSFYPEEISHRFSASYEQPGPGSWSRLAASLFWGRYELVTDRDRAAANGAARELTEAVVEADDYGLRFEAERPVGAARLVAGLDLSGRYGLHATNRTLTYGVSGCCAVPGALEVSIDGARRDDAGAFAAIDGRLGGVLVSAGARLDRVATGNRGGYFGDTSTSRTASSGFLATTIRLARDLELSLQAARGFRDALLSDRYYRGITGRGFITGNPDLRPETSRQLDAALRYDRPGLRVAAYGYLYRIDDLIERARSGDDFFFRNRERASLRGAELEAEVDVTGTLQLRIAAQAEHGEIAGAGQPLDGIPARGLLLTVRDDAGRWGWWFARFRAHARDRRPGPSERVVPGWAVVDAGVGLKLGSGVEVDVLGRNLLDQAYLGSADEKAVLAPGRTLQITLRGTL